MNRALRLLPPSYKHRVFARYEIRCRARLLVCRHRGVDVALADHISVVRFIKGDSK